MEPDFGGLAAEGAAGSSGTVGTLSRARGGSLGARLSNSCDGCVSGTPLGGASGTVMAGCERGRGTDGRLPVAVSLVLNAPVSLANASPMARSESLPVSAAATASRDDDDAS